MKFKIGDRVKTFQGCSTIGVVIDRSLLDQYIKNKLIIGREYIDDYRSRDILVKEDNGFVYLNPEFNLYKI